MLDAVELPSPAVLVVVAKVPLLVESREVVDVVLLLTKRDPPPVSSGPRLVFGSDKVVLVATSADEVVSVGVSRVDVDVEESGVGDGPLDRAGSCAAGSEKVVAMTEEVIAILLSSVEYRLLSLLPENSNSRATNYPVHFNVL